MLWNDKINCKVTGYKIKYPNSKYDFYYVKDNKVSEKAHNLNNGDEFHICEIQK